MQNVFQFLTVLFSGLTAGLFYSYSCSVNPGLRALSDEGYVKAMQSINSAIQNPVFFAAFMGLLVVFPVSVYLSYKQATDASFYCLLLAAIIYFVGVFGITVFCNVPLNENLANFPTATATAVQISALRRSFEQPWNSYHAIRTIASILSFSLSIVSTIKGKY